MAVDDSAEFLAELYEAVGHVDRWRRVTERLTCAPKRPAELERHLEIARRAHERHVMLAEQIEALAAVQDQLALGALLVDRDGRMLRANGAGNRLLAEAEGLVRFADRVQATHPGAELHLRAAIQRAASAQPRGALESPFVVVPRSGRQPLAILVLSAPAGLVETFLDQEAVALLVIDCEIVAAPGPDALRDVFGFTPREAEFATMLCQGASVKEAAQGLGVTLATARSFLAQVAAKTDSHSQAELVRQLLAIPRLVVPDTGNRF